MAETSRQEEALEPISPEEEARRTLEKWWLETEDPTEMLELGDTPLSVNLLSKGRRRLGLFNLACHNRALNYYKNRYPENDPNVSHALEESYRNIPLYSEEELDNIKRSNNRDDVTTFPGGDITPENVRASINFLILPFFKEDEEGYEMDDDVEVEEKEQANLLRDIYRNPFAKEKIELSPEWRTSTVVAVAKDMYEKKDFGPMPILADALEDAGCTDEEILNHCRATDCPHVRGCWVIDLLLEKN